MPVPLESVAARYNLQRFSFAWPKIAQSQGTTAMPVFASDATSGTLTVTSYIMPWQGWIVALTADVSAAVTAGTLTLTPTIAGTGVASTTNVVQVFSAAGQDVAIPGTPVAQVSGLYFKAGQQLGCTIASNGGLLPNGTADVLVNLYVVFDVPLL